MTAHTVYLDANATTPVLPAAQAAALAAMAQDYGNPSSTHSSGLQARALIDRSRATARRVLGLPAEGHSGAGQLLFVSGATEGIQTAVLSALRALVLDPASRARVDTLLYGATEHKAVPEALRHWNELLGLGLQVQAIPVNHQGQHDLAWLREHAPRAALVCTMAANNETGAVSELDGIEAALADSPALWLVDGVQALGKLDLQLARRRIDYAAFSGHKLYAPKGIGLLYVREGAPSTPLMAGGGQEQGLRAGTENMAGIAALGAVLQALEDSAQGSGPFADAATLRQHQLRLVDALLGAFPGLVFNLAPGQALPTTLNIAVPGASAQALLNLLDAVGIRASGGSACSAGRDQPSAVLVAMGLPDWQARSAVRLSFGPADDAAFIDDACAHIRACGVAWRSHARTETGLLRELAANASWDLLGEQAQRLLADGHDLLWVDVRDAAEQALGPLPISSWGGRLAAAPLADWLPALQDHETAPPWLAPLQAGAPLPKVVFVCRSGQRGRQAATGLRQAGYRACWNLAGGLALQA